MCGAAGSHCMGGERKLPMRSEYKMIVKGFTGWTMAQKIAATTRAMNKWMPWSRNKVASDLASALIIYDPQ